MAADEASQNILRLQFKAMQEMQHKRLQKQMEKKREKELSLKSRADDPEEPLEVSDGLSLLHTGEPNSKNSFEKRVLEDEIEHLRNELRETVDENGRLYKLLKERDFEIKHLKKKIEEDRLAFTGTAGVAGDMVATKIVELSKKNRLLMAESEGAKTRVKQLTNRIQELERELQTALTRMSAKGATDAGAKPLRAQMGDRALPETPEVKALQDRLAATNLKMSDLRNQIQSVKQELRMAQKDQLKQLQEILGSLSLQEEKTRVSQHHLDQQLNSEAQRSNSLVAQLRAMVAEREAKVRQLEMEIGQLNVHYLRNKGVGEGSSGREVSPAYTQFLEDPGLTKSPASADDHIDRLGSSRSVTSLGHTLVESALTRPSLPSPHRTSPRFSDSPEQKGWQAQVTEIKALWQAAEVERDRLTEFVTVLQKRVEESNSKLLESERKLQEERHRTVVLEQHLEKIRLEPGKASASQRAAPRTKAGLPTSNTRQNPTGSEKKDPPFAQLSDVPVESQMEELTTRLAVQVEENEMLKAALGSALRGKEEDFRMYHEILGQVKSVFLQALRQQKTDKQ
ncbi:coiled-coil domain-containing protein 13 isoform X9 [Macaca fascicularis]|uniref:coiled-coil domain-containing protein 13 isoform X9 n=1 Tax=Macaca fascicularis TaxID=9541 RepID=UPI003D15E96C